VSVPDDPGLGPSRGPIDQLVRRSGGERSQRRASDLTALLGEAITGSPLGADLCGRALAATPFRQRDR